MADQEELPHLPQKPDPKKVIHQAPLVPLGGQVAQLEFRIGPLPPPTELKKYDEVLPGLANRLMSLVENEQAIQDKEQTAILKNEKRKIDGSIIVSIFLILLSALSLWLGYPEAAIVFGVSGPLSPVVRALANRWLNGQA